MRVVQLILAAGLIVSAASGQPNPDGVVAQFATALVVGDEARMSSYLSDEVRVLDINSLDPSSAAPFYLSGKDKALLAYHNALNKVGQPRGVKCVPVEINFWGCKFDMDRPEQEFAFLALVDGNKIVSLSVRSSPGTNK